MEPKRPRGRPAGSAYPLRLLVYEDHSGMGLLEELARRRGLSKAALVRQLVREEAARIGIHPAGGSDG